MKNGATSLASVLSTHTQRALENRLHALEVRHAGIDLLKAHSDELLNLGRRRRLTVAESQKRRDIVERKPRGLSGTDEPQTLELRFSVSAIGTGAGAQRGRKKSATLVVAHGGGRDAGGGRESSDCVGVVHTRQSTTADK